MGIQKIIMCLTSLLIIGCTLIKKEEIQKPLPPVETEFNGNFPSLDLRLMWQSCAIQFIPLRISPHIYAPYCDCATDFMRRRYNKEEVKGLTAKEAKELGPLINIECQQKVPIIQPT